MASRRPRDRSLDRPGGIARMAPVLQCSLDGDMQMRRLAAILCGLWLVSAFSIGPAHAQKRVALVVGNGAYQNASALSTPANDAGAMADLFRKSGFDVVEAKTDLSNIDFKRLVREFSSVARDAEIAVMYFSGHGGQRGGRELSAPGRRQARERARCRRRGGFARSREAYAGACQAHAPDPARCVP